jgi:rhamnose utilization protein RhaD (predicted bifunctional aldolase and dehydrogenase)
MKKTITYQTLISFVNEAHVYLEKNKDKETELTSAIKSVQKQIRKDELIEEYQEKITNNNLDKCAVDEKTSVILKDEKGGLKFTVENQKAVNKFNKELLKETIEIHQRIPAGIEDLEKELTDLQREAFSGIVITEIKEIED